MTRLKYTPFGRKTTVGLLAVVVVLSFSTTARAQRKSSLDVLAAFRAVVARPSESTVRVLCDGKEAALGTIVGADGWVLTKASELKGKVSCQLKDGKTLPASVVGVEDKTDLAMLKVAATGLKPVEWRDSKSAEVGNWLASPGTGEDPVAVGVVSVAARKPAPSDMPGRRVARNAGYLGVGLEGGSDGPKIGMISPRSPAAKAGLQVGDLVLRVSGKAVKDPGTLVELIQQFKAGTKITVEVKRGEEVKEFKLTLSRRPADLDRSAMQNSMGSKLSEKRNGFPRILQHDQVIKPTDCGGPLVDLDGKAVGINIARAGRVESYALPSETVQALIPELKSGKLAPKTVVAEADGQNEELKKSLEKARAEMAALEKALRENDGRRQEAEKQKKALEAQLAGARKKLDDALQALEKSRKDPTKK
jgi:serine protease Do